MGNSYAVTEYSSYSYEDIQQNELFFSDTQGET